MSILRWLRANPRYAFGLIAFKVLKFALLIVLFR